MKKLLLAVIGISTIFVSCENELDIYAENEESMVVFGLINPKDTVHYIKVQKSFQEEGNEVQAALDPSIIYYDDNEITVYVDEYEGTSKTDSFEFSPVWLSNRDSGAFAHPNNKVYKYVTPNPGAELVSEFSTKSYKLRVVKHDDDTKVNSESAIGLSNLIFLTDPKFNSSTPSKPLKLYNNNGKINFAWQQDGGGKETFDLRFYYVEENINSGVKDTLFVNYSLYSDVPDKSKKEISLNTDDFLARLALRIAEKDDVRRYPLNVKKATDGSIIGFPIEIDIWSAQSDLSTYLNVTNASSIGLVESNITHSNIENGIGLFSSRTNYNLRFDEGVNSLYFDLRSLDSLSCSSRTRNLNFVKYSKDLLTTEIIFDDSPTRCN